MGSYTTVQDASGTAAEFYVCTLATPVSEPFDVFGTPFSAGPILCLQHSVGGVSDGLHCQSVAPGLYSADITNENLAEGTQVCADPPACTHTSTFIEISNVAGSAQDAVMANLPAGSSLSYTLDGNMGPQAIIMGASPIDGCPTLGPGYGHSAGVTAVNAFLVEPTPTGADVTTSSSTAFFNPITQQEVEVTVDVTFSGVTEAGSTTVMAKSNDDTPMDVNFAVAVGGFHTAFLDISTTASITPPITICMSYDDVGNDGVLDGTSISETALRFLHGEGDPVVFVDSTSSQDTDANKICATVDHLSPFAIAVQTAQCGSAPRDGCRAAAKSQLSLDENADAHDKDALSWKWTNGVATTQGEFGNPATTASTEFCVFDANGRVLVAAVPKAATCGSEGESCWKTLKTMGYSFKDKSGANDGIKGLALKGNSEAPKSKVQVKGSGVNLPDPAMTLALPVTVQLVNDSPGGACFEAVYDGSQVLENSGTAFRAKAP